MIIIIVNVGIIKKEESICQAEILLKSPYANQ